MRVLLTGGAGYIGSHTALVLLERGHDVIVLDDFSNSSVEAVRRVEELSGRSVPVIDVDLAERGAARAALDGVEFDSVVHFAGLKAVGESVQQPTRYYRVNIASTIELLDLMHERGVHRLVFSSSATVYGDPDYVPIDEDHRHGVGVTSPYGWTKSMIEQIIIDTQRARPELGAMLLRYFNPVGAHPSGRIGEDPTGIPNNLMPFITQVAVGKRERLGVFGDTYDTHDGTCLRDYIHVLDLAEGHAAALERVDAGVRVYNLGSGTGSSVLDVVRAFEEATGLTIPYSIEPARDGDVTRLIADPTAANAELGWRTTRSLAEACRDAWAWQSANPEGYGG